LLPSSKKSGGMLVQGWTHRIDDQLEYKATNSAREKQ
jgi:hypothetical protein